jgi:hypothetical protein
MVCGAEYYSKRVLTLQQHNRQQLNGFGHAVGSLRVFPLQHCNHLCLLLLLLPCCCNLLQVIYVQAISNPLMELAQ